MNIDINKIKEDKLSLEYLELKLREENPLMYNLLIGEINLNKTYKKEKTFSRRLFNNLFTSNIYNANIMEKNINIYNNNFNKYEINKNFLSNCINSEFIQEEFNKFNNYFYYLYHNKSKFLNLLKLKNKIDINNLSLTYLIDGDLLNKSKIRTNLIEHNDNNKIIKIEKNDTTTIKIEKNIRKTNLSIKKMIEDLFKFRLITEMNKIEYVNDYNANNINLKINAKNNNELEIEIKNIYTDTIKKFNFYYINKSFIYKDKEYLKKIDKILELFKNKNNYKKFSITKDLFNKIQKDNLLIFSFFNQLIENKFNIYEEKEERVPSSPDTSKFSLIKSGNLNIYYNKFSQPKDYYSFSRFMPLSLEIGNTIKPENYLNIINLCDIIIYKINETFPENKKIISNIIEGNSSNNFSVKYLNNNTTSTTAPAIDCFCGNNDNLIKEINNFNLKFVSELKELNKKTTFDINMKNLFNNIIKKINNKEKDKDIEFK